MSCVYNYLCPEYVILATGTELCTENMHLRHKLLNCQIWLANKVPKIALMLSFFLIDEAYDGVISDLSGAGNTQTEPLIWKNEWDRQQLYNSASDLV